MKITIDISEEILKEIEEFKQRQNISDDSTAIFTLIKSALSLPEYFRTFDWQKAEIQADENILDGNIKTFEDVDEFISELNS
ncbi:MAG: hypothetical protein N3A62_10865 [Thermodesulfovibrionales bacterium]|nr:hypothetical protein [Thermodesulfovibrionales bacterium]